MEVSTNRENIQGWGIDLKPEDRPAYPMWKRNDNTGSHYAEDEIPMQEVKFKEFHSIERPHMTPVFGQTVAPGGLSGLIRKVAFRYSENRFAHWLPLLFADRINVVEGLIDDLLHLRIPNLWKEMGLSAEWKYNRKNFVKKIAVTGTLLAATWGVLTLMKEDGNKRAIDLKKWAR